VKSPSRLPLLTLLALFGTTAQAELVLPPPTEMGERLTPPSAFAEPAPGVALDVPPVYRRPLGVEEGPRVHVAAFRLTGVVERPELGITLEALGELVEGLRRERQGLNESLLQGLSGEDARAIARTLLDEETPAADYPALIEQLRRSKKFRESLTMGQIQEVANAVTAYYRRAGLVVAVAYVPAQMVRDGVVTIQVMAGRLTQVRVRDNQLYDSATLSAPFDDLRGLAVNQAELESALLRVSDFPGLNLSGVLAAGERLGETDLQLAVTGERRHAFNLRGDNYGSGSTGEYRGRLGYQLNNPLGRADQLNLTLLQTYQPDNSTYGSLRYQMHLWNERNLGGFEVSKNSFEVGQEFQDLKVTGNARVASLFYRNDILRSRQLNLYAEASLDSKFAETLQVGTVIFTDRLTNLALELGFDQVDTRRSGINQGSVRLVQGLGGVLGAMDASDAPMASRIGGSGERAGASFTKWVVNFSRFQSLGRTQNLLLRANLLYSADSLVSLEQSSLGGPGSVRAYPVAEYLRDQSLYLGLDWNFNAPGFAERPAFGGRSWGEIFQLALTFDAAYGKASDPLVDEREPVRLYGAGVAAQLLIPDTLQVRFDLSAPLGDGEPSNDRNPQYYLMIDYSF